MEHIHHALSKAVYGLVRDDNEALALYLETCSALIIGFGPGLVRTAIRHEAVVNFSNGVRDAKGNPVKVGKSGIYTLVNITY